MLRTIFFSPANVPASAYQRTASIRQLTPQKNLRFGGSDDKATIEQHIALLNMPLLRQLQANKPEIARQFAENIKQKYGSYDAPIFGKQKATLLHQAVLFCSPKVVETLVQMGCNPEVMDTEGLKPVDWLNKDANKQSAKNKAEIRALLQPKWLWPISGMVNQASTFWKTITDAPSQTIQFEMMQTQLEALQQRNLRLQNALGKFGDFLIRLNHKYQSEKRENQVLSTTNTSALRHLQNTRTKLESLGQTTQTLELREAQLDTLLTTFQHLNKELEDQRSKIQTLMREKKGLESAQNKQDKKSKALTEQNTTLLAEKERLDARIKALKMNQERNGQQITKFLDEAAKKSLNSPQLEEEIQTLKNAKSHIQMQLQDALETSGTIEELQQSIQMLLSEISESDQPPLPEESELPEEREIVSKPSQFRSKSQEPQAKPEF